jgi:hypothetical protein
MLQTLGVETLVLPAVPELLETWIGAFGFQPMDTFPKQTLIEMNLMAFPGTSLLHKSLARLQPVAGLCVYPHIICCCLMQRTMSARLHIFFSEVSVYVHC